jgi:hypothetical protein
MGVLMATHKMTHNEAFELLRSTSQNCDPKVRDIALDVIEQGELPEYAHALPQTEAGRSTRSWYPVGPGSTNPEGRR